MIAELQDISWVTFLRADELTTYFKLFIIFGKPALYVFVFSAWFWLRGGKNMILFFLAALFATISNSLLKLTFQIPRPPVENFLVNASSFGFPSGDAQIVATIFFLLAFFYRSKLVGILAVLVTLNSMASRVYLGVHSPLDVIAGASIGILTAFAFNTTTIRSLASNWVIGKSLKYYWVFAGVTTFLSIIIFFDTINTPLAIALGSMYGLGIALRQGHINKTRNTSPYIVLTSTTILAILYLILPNTFITGEFSWVNRTFEFFIITLYIFMWAPKIFDAIKRDKELKHI